MVTFPRAEITTVSIGLIQFDGLMLEDGTFGIAVPQACSVFQIPNKNAQRDIKSILGKSFQFLKWRSALHPKAVNVLLLPDFELLIFELMLKQHSIAIEIGRSLMGLTLQQLFCDAFNIKFEQEERQEWLTNRQRTKETFRACLTDALKKSGFTEPWQYGKFIHQLQEGLGIKDGTRDELSIKELSLLTCAQEYIGMAIADFNCDPYRALSNCLEKFGKN
jgi:hypothetical protein